MADQAKLAFAVEGKSTYGGPNLIGSQNLRQGGAAPKINVVKQQRRGDEDDPVVGHKRKFQENLLQEVMNEDDDDDSESEDEKAASANRAAQKRQKRAVNSDEDDEVENKKPQAEDQSKPSASGPEPGTPESGEEEEYLPGHSIRPVETVMQKKPSIVST